MKKDIFFYSVSEIREYMLNLCEYGKAGDAFNIVLSSFALIFFALLPSFIAKENTKELHSMADYYRRKYRKTVKSIKTHT